MTKGTGQSLRSWTLGFGPLEFPLVFIAVRWQDLINE